MLNLVFFSVICWRHRHRKGASMPTLERPSVAMRNQSAQRKNFSPQKDAAKREIADRLRARLEYLRRTRGIDYTLEMIAARFSRLRGVGISRVGFGKYFTGENEISVSDLGFIAEALETEVAYLLGTESLEETQEHELVARMQGLNSRERASVYAVVEALARHAEDDADESVYGRTTGKKAE